MESAAPNRELYARMCIVVAEQNPGALPHAVARAVKQFLASSDPEHVATLTIAEAAQDAALAYDGPLTSSSPHRASASSPSSSSRLRTSPQLAASARRAMAAERYSHLTVTSSSSPSKVFVSESDLPSSPGKGFGRMPPLSRLRPSPDKGLWAEMTKRDKLLAEAEAKAAAARKEAASAECRADMEEEMRRQAQADEDARRARDSLAVQARREAAMRARQTRQEAEAKAQKHAKELADVSAFNSKELAAKKAAKDAETAMELARLGELQAQAKEMERLAQEKARKKREQIASFMRENEEELAYKARHEAAERKLELEATMRAQKDADEKEAIRVAEAQARADVMKAKLDRMQNFLTAAADQGKLAEEKAARELAERDAIREAAAIERARAHRSLMESCGAAMREQMREKQEAARVRAVEVRLEHGRLVAQAKIDNAAHKAKLAKSRSEAVAVKLETERIIINRARERLQPDDTPLERSLHGPLVKGLGVGSSSPGGNAMAVRGTTPW